MFTYLTSSEASKPWMETVAIEMVFVSSSAALRGCVKQMGVLVGWSDKVCPRMIAAISHVVPIMIDKKNNRELIRSGRVGMHRPNTWNWNVAGTSQGCHSTIGKKPLHGTGMPPALTLRVVKEILGTPPAAAGAGSADACMFKHGSMSGFVGRIRISRLFSEAVRPLQ